VINLYLYKAVGDLSIVPWKSAQLTVFLLERFRLPTRFPMASTTGPYRKLLKWQVKQDTLRPLTSSIFEELWPSTMHVRQPPPIVPAYAEATN
jgi:hypothetical protein